MNKDIGPILEGWPHEPGQVSVRKVRGRDGRPKIQLRVDLGLLQMEVKGRPDGQRPYGCASLLQHLEKQLAGHRRAQGTDEGFTVDEKHCEMLRSEAVQYYYRYLGEFVLEEYEAVVRDTARNLRALDFCNKYAGDESDRFLMEQYRPYILMMNTRARAHLAMRDDRPKVAGRIVRRALGRIRRFFVQMDQEELYDSSAEVATLTSLLKDVESKIPVDPVRQLKRELAEAVKEERYEDAARLRDAIQAADALDAED